MKKTVIVIFLALITFSFDTMSQVQLGLKFAPTITTNRINAPTSPGLSISDNGTFFKLSLGLIVDKNITDTYSFSTGLIYLPKSIGISAQSNLITPGNNINEEYNLQYLQVPLTFKLFTNEISPSFKIYFQVGGALEVLVFDEPIDDTNTIVDEFNFFDASVILGAGTEYKLGSSTILFGGISYHRGLINVVNDLSGNFSNADGLEARNTLVSLDLGIKF